MRSYFDPDVRHALEVLAKARTSVRLEVACLLIRQSVVDPSVGLVGRDFLRESESGLQAVLDWIAVGDREALVPHVTSEEMEAEEVSL